MKNTIKIYMVLIAFISTYESKAQICFNVQPSVLATAAFANKICSADFNHDGFQDIASSNSSGTCSVLLGNGVGAFNSITEDSIDNFALSICAADFDNDSHIDIATYNNGNGYASILKGDGNGGFTLLPGQIAGGIWSAQASLCASDYNNDGKIDLLLSTSNFGVKLAIGNGNGTFSPFTYISVTESVSGQIIKADFNNDGNADIACIGSVLLGNGLGLFTASAALPTNYNSKSVVANDFNEDGKTDIVSADWGAGANAGFVGNISVYNGDGAGNFSLPVQYTLGDSTITPNTGSSNQLICSGDFNGDGHADVALCTWKTNITHTHQVTVMLGNGLGDFAAPIDIPVPVGYIASIVSLDMNNDGKLDIAISSKTASSSSYVSILLNCSYATNLSFVDSDSYEVSVYPNPSEGFINISSLGMIDEISLVNVMGQTVFEAQPKTSRIIIPQLASGLYMASISSANKIFVRKIIVR